MAAFAAVTLVVVVVQDIPLGNYLQRVERDRIVTALERDAFLLAGRVEDTLEAATAPNPQVAADVHRYRQSSGARVVIVNSAGVAILTSDDDQSATGSSYRSRPEIATALSGEIATGQRHSVSLDTDLLYVAVPVVSGDRVIGAVRLTYPTQVVTDEVRGHLAMLWLVAGITVLLAGALAYVMASTVTRRLRQLRSTTELLAEGRLDTRTPLAGGAPEIRSLERSVNRMADRLEDLLRQQRAFAADASHQLRTPLTALRLRLDSAAELFDTDPDAARDTLVSAQEEAIRLQRIIDGLLMLSRTQAGIAPEEVDLAELARARADQWQPLADESDVRIAVAAPPTAPALAVPGAAEQIIDNLIDNALAVSPPGSTIEVAVAPALDADFVDVHVRDEGPGMSAEDCVRAFDRFWRGSSDTGGSGLGLAIVARLARVSGATAELIPRSLTGARGLDAHVRFSGAEERRS
ncbi:ATP-binding protein [Mycobacterium sp. CVI_P3]|uniref:histidine kinase n=1 Tax=Mycobacterium pinniadriaticum TaxID=2994102 RepID=A0ABT3SL68_9MYCO|nr:ATP-binding protein [Mycobacterium pinniadriaticum]MCX2933883.1 ATP-binding protein [Mycobacterium pinniadriaticum]MCX2940264.1 ATP-binding protein [Mycobacterium pinniadriaticum]